MKDQRRVAIPGLSPFLKNYPGMTIRPTTGHGLIMHGKFCFSAQPEGGVEITDTYNLRIEVPKAFPFDLPRVTELDDKIPRTGKYHVNPDGTLCLGSPLRLLWKLSRKPTLSGFASDCLVPYLYAVSHKLKFGGDLPFSELEHGTPGALQDYADLFSLEQPEQAQRALHLLGMKKVLANKQPCPCGCGKKLKACQFNKTISKFRRLAHRSWFKALSDTDFTKLKNESKELEVKSFLDRLLREAKAKT